MNTLDWLTDNVLGWFVMSLLTTVFGFMIYVIIISVLEHNRPTFDLKKDEWKCTREYEWYSSLKGMVITHHDCIRWEHK